jgi:hypothetical protein
MLISMLEYSNLDVQQAAAETILALADHSGPDILEASILAYITFPRKHSCRDFKSEDIQEFH